MVSITCCFPQDCVLHTRLLARSYLGKKKKSWVCHFKLNFYDIVSNYNLVLYRITVCEVSLKRSVFRLTCRAVIRCAWR